MELKLERESDLWDCEKALKTITTSTTSVHVQLSRIERKIPLKDLRVVAVISALSQAGTGTCGWENNISIDNQNLLINLAMKTYPVTEQGSQSETSIEEVKKLLANQNDILEDPPGRGETLTVCAIDHKSKARPSVLPTEFNKTKFIRVIGNLVQEYFDSGTSTNFSRFLGFDLFDVGLSKAEHIFGMIYELYNNTFSHGCLDENNRVVPGLRLIRLRKRSGHGGTREGFIKGARGFTELEYFFQQTAPLSKSFKFYEISISDNGIGILNRFQHTRGISVQNSKSREANLQLLNEIVEKSLSSDSTKSGSGEGGLKNVLKAVDEVRGFVSLRCNNLWVYRNSEEQSDDSKGNWLKHVGDSSDLANISGTHFSIFLLASQ